MRATTLPIAALAAVLFAAGCGDGPAITEATADREPELEARAGAAPAELAGLLAARRATRPFKDLGVAQQAGYDFLFMDMCMEDESPDDLGGMGYHWVDTTLLDAHLDVTRPEALLYEPLRDGRVRLVGLEYVVPAAAWTASTPPTLLGQELRLNQFGLWALHVWVWTPNPSGIYADWNPRVSCEYAGAAPAGHTHNTVAEPAAVKGRVR